MITKRGSGFGWWTRCAAAGVAAVVVSGLLSGVAYASPEPGPDLPPKVKDREPVVAGKKAGVKPRRKQRRSAALPAPKWPKAGSATVDLVAAEGRARSRFTRAGQLPVWLQPTGAEDAARSDEPGSVQVEVLTASHRRRVGGVAFTLSPSRSAAYKLAVRLDYSGFARGYGGDYGNRLRLVQLPPCFVSTPDKARCQKATPIASARNHLASQTLTATVDTSGSQTMVLAAAAGDSSDKGDYKASSLSPSATWQVSEQTGAFSWDYPLRMPPTPGGLNPGLSVGYSSGSVDGRTSNTNNQPSWIGEGFDLSPGYIERRYKSCADDGAPTDEWGNKPGDQCWAYGNATVTWNGKGGELIKTGDGSWRMKNDDGTKFEKLKSDARGNGDNSNEYWRVTTTDGVRYYFGFNRLPGWASGSPETKSTWTVPVFGDDAGEPCHDATFASSWCQQAWRWNLDYVVDPHGNAVAYYYNQEINYYGRNLTPSAETRYVRGGWLARVPQLVATQR